MKVYDVKTCLHMYLGVYCESMVTILIRIAASWPCSKNSADKTYAGKRYHKLNAYAITE
jgi:hypothetical protein